MNSFYDVVVIGSGFGGSVAGLRLAEAGYSVAILERGRWWAGAHFPRRVRDMWKIARTRWNPTGLYDIRDFDGVTVYSGNGVGGGSLLSSNVLARPPSKVLATLPEPLAESMLEPGYRRVRSMLGATTWPAAEDNRKAAQLRALAASIPAAHWRPVELAIHLGGRQTVPDVRDYPHSGQGRAACVGCRQCNLGCHLLAKNTLDLTYLPAAMRAGATLFERCEVTRLRAGHDGGYEICFRRSGRPVGGPRSGSVRARRVVLAAGVIGSTELLLRARRRGDLRNLSDRLGTRFSVNGVHVAMGYNAVESITNPISPVVVSSVTCPHVGAHVGIGADSGDVRSGTFDILLEDANQSPLLTGLAGRGLPWLQDLGARLSRALARDGLRGLLGAARALKGNLLPPAVDSRTVTLMVMSRDAANGTIRLKGSRPGHDDGELAVSWRWADNRDLLGHVNRLLEELGRSAHVQVRFTAIDPDARVYTGHPLGGCPAGDGPETGVVSAVDGQVFGHPGLHVMDGSTVPAALGVNPSLTIAAQAELMSARLIARTAGS